jgi:hypothetical protein
MGRHAASATLLATTSRDPDSPLSRNGFGGQVFYAFETKPIVVVSQLEHYDRGFQMDTAFLNQVGITQGWTYVAPSFYPDEKKYGWFKRVVPFAFLQYGKDHVQDGRPWIFVPGVRMNFTRQGFFRADAIIGDEIWQGRTFDIRNFRVWGEAQITGWLRFYAQTTFGRSIFYDVVDPYLGQHRTWNADVTLQPTSRLSQSASYNRVEFDRLGGEPVYTVNVLNTRTSFQLNREFFLRAIVQYDSSRRRVLTDFLASWELLPGTVAYAGYGSLIERQEWDGQAFQPGRGDYYTTERGFFFKASYIHRF